MIKYIYTHVYYFISSLYNKIIISFGLLFPSHLPLSLLFSFDLICKESCKFFDTVVNTQRMSSPFLHYFSLFFFFSIYFSRLFVALVFTFVYFLTFYLPFPRHMIFPRFKLVYDSMHNTSKFNN